MQTLAVGCGAGFSGDRVDAAAPVVRTLIERGGPAALIFENLAERTLATQQLAKRANAQLGYEPLLELELKPVLADCLAHGIVIVGNFGAANPDGAARLIQRLALELGLPAPRIAVLRGDDLSDASGRAIVRDHLPAFDDSRFVCANVYQGAFEIAAAIRAGAQIVVTGRVADPSLTLGPAIAHFGWSADQWDALAGATMAGHLLECGAQVSGGYFADPGLKDVPGLHDVGFPIAEIAMKAVRLAVLDHTVLRGGNAVRMSVLGFLLTLSAALAAPTSLGFDQFYSSVGIRGPVPTALVQQLRGTEVAVQGYVAPGQEGEAPRLLVLTAVPILECPYCMEAADWPNMVESMWRNVLVLLPGGLQIPAPGSYVRVVGRFEFGNGPLPLGIANVATPLRVYASAVTLLNKK